MIMVYLLDIVIGPGWFNFIIIAFIAITIFRLIVLPILLACKELIMIVITTTSTMVAGGRAIISFFLRLANRKPKVNNQINQ